MKRIRTIFILAMAFLCLTAQAQSGLRPRGDVNCDWEVNIADVNAVIDSIFNNAQYHKLYSYATDVNGDQEINIADINMIIDAINGKDLPAMPCYSGTLPVLYINTDGHRNIDSKEEYVHARWWLDAMGVDGATSIGSSQSPKGMQIKGRGNYTWTIAKKSFRIKLDTKQAILGMKSNRHFCLLAHADDHYAKLMNEVGFELSRRIGLAYTPEQRPVEVVLNGQYIGLYFLADKIRVEKDRVNIVEQEDEETDPERITGGWLLEIDNNTDENTIYIQERNNGEHWYDWLWITSHSPENLSAEQRQYIQQFLESANAAIYSGNKIDREWERYIDIDSLACFYIIAEMLDDIESFSGSCYMHKQKGDTTKLIFGPVWDFGNAFHRKNYADVPNYNYFIYQQPCFFYNHWIEEIAKHLHFQLAVRIHWRKFYDSNFNGLDLDKFIDDHVSLIRDAWYCNAARWTGDDIEWETDQFKQCIHSKIDWLQSQWGPEHNIDPNGGVIQLTGSK